MSFLPTPPSTPEVEALFAEDVEEMGYVMNASRSWAYQPSTVDGLFALMRQSLGPIKLSMRERGILVAACASTFGDSYCSLAWGSRLAGASSPEMAAAVIAGDDTALTPAEQAMAAWARAVARDPNGTTATQVQALREAGLDDAQIFAITAFVALRIAFSTVNDALGVRPDAQMTTTVPEPVRSAVTFGRPIAE